MLPWPVESMVFQALLICRVVLYPAPRFRRFARAKTAERRVPPDVEAAHTCTAGCRQVDARPKEPDESTRHFIFHTMGLPYTILCGHCGRADVMKFLVHLRCMCTRLQVWVWFDWRLFENIFYLEGFLLVSV